MREKELQQKREEMDLLRGLALQNTNAQSSPSASKQQLSDMQRMLQLQQQQQMQMQQQFMIQNSRIEELYKAFVENSAHKK